MENKDICTRDSEQKIKLKTKKRRNVRVCEVESEFGLLKDKYLTKIVVLKFYSDPRKICNKILLFLTFAGVHPASLNFLTAKKFYDTDQIT